MSERGIVYPKDYSADILLERLGEGVRRNDRPVTFLVGSALSAPFPAGSPGVPTTAGVVELIRKEFEGAQRESLDAELALAENKYQEAFRFLQGRRGPEIANGIIKQAVWQARRIASIGVEAIYCPGSETDDETCKASELDTSGWYLSPAHAALGRLIANEKRLFGGSVLTTNFDPLIEVSIDIAGGGSFRTVLHRDGDLGQTHGGGCHVVHLHGYWYGSDTLHSPRQLTQSRPRLKASLSHLIAGRTVVVMGYGGWDDVFTRALMEVVLDDRSSPDVIWTFKGANPDLHKSLLQHLEPGIDRGRVTFYVGVDCHEFLPQLATAWIGDHCQNSHSTQDSETRIPIRLVESPSLGRTEDNLPRTLDFSRGEQDHPPKLEFYVGRADELAELHASSASITYLTGIGGAGKSALAADYSATAQAQGAFDYYVWRDCKEESERFERQLVSIVAVLGGGRVSEYELATQPIESITELFIKLSGGVRILIIFDNIDHYVDLHRGILTGTAARFCDRFLEYPSSSKIIFTCRPTIEHIHDSACSLRLEGITLDDAVELFRLRKAYADQASIQRAHELTRGHAFWLDLLAAQVARRAPQVDLADLLRSFDTDTPELPTATLRSIWGTLPERERLVLQSLAETVRPTPILQLAHYLSSRLRYNQLHRAVKSLKGLSLLVVKPQDSGQEVIELHPLVRAFVRTNFAKLERSWFIHSILDVYKVVFGSHRADLIRLPANTLLDYWTEGAELHLSAGEIAEAVGCLHEIIGPIEQRGSPSEFIRVSRLLFQNADWTIVSKIANFESVIKKYIGLQALAGQIEDCNRVLEGYRTSLDGKDSRYINYCNLQCYMHWVNGDYLTAIKWGVEGVGLKEESGVDTNSDCSHNLALARRDAGIIDPALKYFLKDRKLSEIVAEKKGLVSLGGVYYGNVGRCLHLMGQSAPALSCYTKSAGLLEASGTGLFENRAYIRQWIGEILVSKGDFVAGFAFLEAAKAMWSVLSPPKANHVGRVIADAIGDRASEAQTGESAEQSVARWLRAA